MQSCDGGPSCGVDCTLARGASTDARSMLLCPVAYQTLGHRAHKTKRRKEVAMNMSHAIRRWTAAAFCALTSSAVSAQAYPAKPIEVIVHTSAGSGGDIVSRATAEIVRREKFLPQPLQVVNRVGGAGALAFNFFKTKRGDTYFLLS